MAPLAPERGIGDNSTRPVYVKFEATSVTNAPRSRNLFAQTRRLLGALFVPRPSRPPPAHGQNASLGVVSVNVSGRIDAAVIYVLPTKGCLNSGINVTMTKLHLLCTMGIDDCIIRRPVEHTRNCIYNFGSFLVVITKPPKERIVVSLPPSPSSMVSASDTSGQSANMGQLEMYIASNIMTRPP